MIAIEILLLVFVCIESAVIFPRFLMYNTLWIQTVYTDEMVIHHIKFKYG